MPCKYVMLCNDWWRATEKDVNSIDALALNFQLLKTLIYKNCIDQTTMIKSFMLLVTFFSEWNVQTYFMNTLISHIVLVFDKKTTIKSSVPKIQGTNTNINLKLKWQQSNKHFYHHCFIYDDMTYQESIKVAKHIQVTL